MKHPINTFDFTYLEEVLHTQFDPELLAESLEESLYAIVHYGVTTGQKSGRIMLQFDAAFTLMKVFRKLQKHQGHGDQRNKAAA